MVTGGRFDINNLDTTELLRPGSGWEVISARLPRPMDAVSVTNVDNRILLFGECLTIILLLDLPNTGPCYRGNY